MQAIREQLMNLDIEESLIEKLLKNYPAEKIEEKIDLLLIKRNIKSPAGWLSAALKNDYQNAEQGRYDEEPVEGSNNLNSQIPSPLEGDKKILSSEEARRRFHLLRQKLMAMN